MKFFEVLAWLKNYVTRATGWMSIVNLFLILFTFTKVHNIGIAPLFLMIVGMAGIILVGVIDFFWIMRYQMEHANSRNDLKDDLIKIHKKLDSLESKFLNGLYKKKTDGGNSL